MIENLIFDDEILGNFVGYNTVVKSYSDGHKIFKHSSYMNFKGKPINNSKNGSSTQEQLDRYTLKHVYERKSLIYDIAYENSCIVPWQYFVTLTFDDSRVDGYNFDKCADALKSWLDNCRKKNRDMRYIIVPELHKSGRFHFHGLFANVPNWNLSVATNPKTGRKIYKNGSLIYNLNNYTLGYTTVSFVKDLDAVTFYITKYITKELINLKNRKNYWSSRNLSKPTRQYYYARNYDDVLSYVNSFDHEIVKDKLVNNSSCETHYLYTITT